MIYHFKYIFLSWFEDVRQRVSQKFGGVTDSFENLMDDNALSHVTPSFCLQCWSRGGPGDTIKTQGSYFWKFRLFVYQNPFFPPPYLFSKFERGKGNGLIESSGYLGIYLPRVSPLCY